MRFCEANTREEAEERIGRDWAKLVKVEGGYMAFETLDEYKTWKKQK